MLLGAEQVAPDLGASIPREFLVGLLLLHAKRGRGSGQLKRRHSVGSHRRLGALEVANHAARLTGDLTRRRKTLRLNAALLHLAVDAGEATEEDRSATNGLGLARGLGLDDVATEAPHDTDVPTTDLVALGTKGLVHLVESVQFPVQLGQLQRKTIKPIRRDVGLVGQRGREDLVVLAEKFRDGLTREQHALARASAGTKDHGLAVVDKVGGRKRTVRAAQAFGKVVEIVGVEEHGASEARLSRRHGVVMMKMKSVGTE